MPTAAFARLILSGMFSVHGIRQEFLSEELGSWNYENDSGSHCILVGLCILCTPVVRPDSKKFQLKKSCGLT